MAAPQHQEMTDVDYETCKFVNGDIPSERATKFCVGCCNYWCCTLFMPCALLGSCCLLWCGCCVHTPRHAARRHTCCTCEEAECLKCFDHGNCCLCLIYMAPAMSSGLAAQYNRICWQDARGATNSSRIAVCNEYLCYILCPCRTLTGCMYSVAEASATCLCPCFFRASAVVDVMPVQMRPIECEPGAGPEGQVH
jgi:hypothetical protein